MVPDLALHIIVLAASPRHTDRITSLCCHVTFAWLYSNHYGEISHAVHVGGGSSDAVSSLALHMIALAAFPRIAYRYRIEGVVPASAKGEGAPFAPLSLKMLLEASSRDLKNQAPMRESVGSEFRISTCLELW